MKRSFFMQVAACFLVLFTGSDVFAQSSSQTQTLVSGSADQGILLAPDFKFTELDGKFANLAGVYGGWLIDKKLLLGGGGYFLTNGSDDLEMAYGGFVVEYFLNASRLVNFSVKGLVGGGNATVSAFRGEFPRFDIAPALEQLGNRFGFPGQGPPAGFPNHINFPGFENIRFPDFDDDIEESFFIAEPEANVYLNLTETFTLGFGGGYRFIGAAGRLNQRLDGFTAKVALKITF